MFVFEPGVGVWLAARFVFASSNAVSGGMHRTCQGCNHTHNQKNYKWNTKTDVCRHVVISTAEDAAVCKQSRVNRSRSDGDLLLLIEEKNKQSSLC